MLGFDSRWILVLVLAVGCGDDGDSGSGSGTGDDCPACFAPPFPVCGVDGMTYDAACGEGCVPVEIECDGECPCAAGTDSASATSTNTVSTTNGSSSTASTGSSGSADESGSGSASTGGGELACGDMTCGPDEHVCNVLFAGPAGLPPTYACGSLPAACEAEPDPDCTCFADQGCDCVEGPEDRFELTCYAP